MTVPLSVFLRDADCVDYDTMLIAQRGKKRRTVSTPENASKKIAVRGKPQIYERRSSFTLGELVQIELALKARIEILEKHCANRPVSFWESRLIDARDALQIVQHLTPNTSLEEV